MEYDFLDFMVVTFLLVFLILFLILLAVVGAIVWFGYQVYLMFVGSPNIFAEVGTYGAIAGVLLAAWLTKRRR